MNLCTNTIPEKLLNCYKKGEEDGWYTYACPICGYRTYENNGNYCLNCGSKQPKRENQFMRVVQDIRSHFDFEGFKDCSVERLLMIKNDPRLMKECTNFAVSYFVIVSSQYFTNDELIMMINTINSMHLVLRQVLLKKFLDFIHPFHRGLNNFSSKTSLKHWKGYDYLLHPEKYEHISEVRFVAQFCHLQFNDVGSIEESYRNLETIRNMSEKQSKGELGLIGSAITLGAVATEYHKASVNEKGKHKETKEEKLLKNLKLSIDIQLVLELLSISQEWVYITIHSFHANNPTTREFYDLLVKCQLPLSDWRFFEYSAAYGIRKDW